MISMIQGVSSLVRGVRINGVSVPVKHSRVRNGVLKIESEVRVVSKVVNVDWLSSDVL